MPDDTTPAANYARLKDVLADAQLFAVDMTTHAQDLGARLLDAAPLIAGPTTIEGSYLSALAAVAKARQAAADASHAVASLIAVHEANQP